ncbi:DUF4785 domain-containing protein [Lysobacter solisilvae (ex Woo and Kim 2020)]|uniref:DUF4785 family protein n=1 Tax=Agrilutibacter terrestris TaxID=2865112 RepID=A0A7H0FXQ3_9GAMM|nr:DUF4785 domain-containing protein [Lysobacter terrestris]QNP40819.1 DUF4785 family protein [Lysobacter terrestris]
MNITAALVAACLASPAFAASAAQPLLPAAATDQVPTRLVALPAPAGQFERAPVSFSWALDPFAPLSPSPSYVAESREYWQTVEGSELQAGVALKTSAPGAVIRISPARGSAPLHANAVAMNGNGKAARLERAADAAALQAAGMDVDAGTAVVKLAKENAAGTYSLRTAEARGRYVVHVFEPESDVVLKAHADRPHVLGGDTISVAMDVSRGGRTIAAQAEALLVAPDGSSRPISVTSDKSGRLTARAKLPMQASAAPGLWELQLFATGEGVSRDARTAFGVSAPTARLGDDVGVDASRLRFDIPLESAAPGRYEVRGTLYATASDGAMAPVAQAHSAAWFERGKGALVLAFDRAHVPSGYGAPYELRQLELNDQSRLAPLESRGRAVRF